MPSATHIESVVPSSSARRPGSDRSRDLGRIAASAQATYWSPSRAGIAWNAIRIVCGDDAQKRSSVHAGT